MSKKNPITVSSWTLGDQCKFEDRVIAAKEAGYEGIGLRAETYVDALSTSFSGVKNIVHTSRNTKSRCVSICVNSSELAISTVD